MNIADPSASLDFLKVFLKSLKLENIIYAIRNQAYVSQNQSLRSSLSASVSPSESKTTNTLLTIHITSARDILEPVDLT